MYFALHTVALKLAELHKQQQMQSKLQQTMQHQVQQMVQQKLKTM